MEQVTLSQILEARDCRAEKQQRLLSLYGCPLISFTMNIPGPVKNGPLIRRAFRAGLKRLDNALSQAGLTPLDAEVLDRSTGCEYLCAVSGPPVQLKSLCEAIEAEGPLGRLFDMDVLDENGKKLSREQPRCCLICGAPGKGCASRRLHSVEQLQQATQTLLIEGLLEEDSQMIEALVTGAMLDEVNTTPKPGLVDKNNTGAHRDMNLETFYRSIQALKPFWPACFRLGVQTADSAPEETYARLRVLGKEAEKKMREATQGVNTHKGAIFLLGTICGAAGRLWTPAAPCRDPQAIGIACAAMSHSAVEADFQEIAARGQGRTFGESAYIQFGIRGARGELADGLPTVLRVGLPRLEEGLKHGLTSNDAGATALLYLIANGEDTNLIHRGGRQTAAAAVASVRSLLSHFPYPALASIAVVDQAFIRQNLSPGGSADLLTATWFLYRWQREERP